jgi:hypothetical protein
MTKMPDLFIETEQRAAAVGRGITGLFEHHGAQAAPEPPASRPATMAASAAPARTKENRMSLATIEADLGQRIAAAEAAAHAAVHNEIGKLIADLPAITAEAKQLAATPVGQVAIKAAEHAAAGVLPPEALTYLAGTFEASLNGLVAWYGTPQGTQQAPAGADPAPAGQQPVQAQQGAPAQ